MGHSSDSGSSSGSEHGRCHRRRHRRRERRHERRHHGGLISGLVGGHHDQNHGHVSGHHDHNHGHVGGHHDHHHDHRSGLISGLLGGLLGGGQHGGHQRGLNPGDPHHGGGPYDGYAPPPIPPQGYPQRGGGYPPNQLSDQSHGYASQYHNSGHGDGYGYGGPPVIQREIGNASSSNQSMPPPPAYTAEKTPRPPSSGHRIALDTNSASFPGQPDAGTPPCYEADGTPLYFGSALFERSVFPCKVEVRNRSAKPFVSYSGDEHPHRGRYDLLPYDPAQMELVLTSYGRIPHGKIPVDGGYDESGNKLYHAVATVNGLRLPGKTGEQLGCCYVGRNGIEHGIAENYEILCWREY